MPHHIGWRRKAQWKKKIVSRPWAKAWINPPRLWASWQKVVSKPTFLWVAARKVWVVDLLENQWGVIYCPFWRYYIMSLGCQTFFFQGLDLPLPSPSYVQDSHPTTLLIWSTFLIEIFVVQPLMGDSISPSFQTWYKLFHERGLYFDLYWMALYFTLSKGWVVQPSMQRLFLWLYSAL